MRRLSGELAERELRDVVRTLFLERATGVLEVSMGGNKRRLFFRDGELHLPPTNPLAGQVAGFLKNGADEAEFEDLMGRMAAVIGTWREGAFVFDPGREAVPPDAVGPLPTAQLVMAASVIDRGPDRMLADLGGSPARWVARPLNELPVRSLKLSAPDAEMLERLAEADSVANVLAEADSRDRLIRLCRLAALGLIEREEVRSRGEALISQDVFQRFSERVQAELAVSPVSLDAPAHRARLAELLGKLGELSNYDLLGIGPEARTEDVHAAYGALAKVVHPSHAGRLGLKGREDALTLLFEKATEAYLVLADPDRRARYNAEMGIQSVVVSAPGAAKRDPAELQKLASDLFTRAQEMVDREEFHYAVELLRRAVQADPRAEYYSLLADVQSKNPKWMHHAIDSLKEAVNRDPENRELRLRLATFYERAGDRERARGVYRSVLTRSPGDTTAMAALARMGDGKRRAAADSKPKKKGFFASLFGG